MTPERLIAEVRDRGFIDTLDHYSGNYLIFEKMIQEVAEVDSELAGLLSNAMDGYNEVSYNEREWKSMTKNYERPEDEPL
jgi:hypothetical protein